MGWYEHRANPNTNSHLGWDGTNIDQVQIQFHTWDRMVRTSSKSKYNFTLGMGWYEHRGKSKYNFTLGMGWHDHGACPNTISHLGWDGTNIASPNTIKHLGWDGTNIEQVQIQLNTWDTWDGTNIEQVQIQFHTWDGMAWTEQVQIPMGWYEHK